MNTRSGEAAIFPLWQTQLFSEYGAITAQLACTSLFPTLVGTRHVALWNYGVHVFAYSSTPNCHQSM